MSDISLSPRQSALRQIRRIDPVAAVGLAALALLAMLDAGQARDSVIFVVDALLGVAPFLLLSIAIAAYA